MQTPTPAIRRTWAEIDLDALRHNAAVVRELIGPGPQIMAVVKANAYGHGDVECIQALSGIAVAFGVANVVEAIHVSPAASNADIYILGPALPSEREAIVKGGFVPMVSSSAEARAFAGYGKVRVSLAVDTGMGRSGVWWEELRRTVEEIRAIPGCSLIGAGTHLPVPDDDMEFTNHQLGNFDSSVHDLDLPVVHALNSAGVIWYAGHAHDMVRAGLILYGASPIPEFQPRLKPVMTWKTRLVLVRDVPAGRSVSYGRTFITPRPMRIGTISAGYADGYTRRLSNRGAEVLVHGKRCAVLGRITMDMVMIDVTDLEEPPVPGDEVVLLGAQGEEQVTAQELADKSSTISWEIFTGVAARVERVYIANVPDCV